jgi:hypothetical protein
MSGELRRAKVLAKVFVCTENTVEAAPSYEGIGSTALRATKGGSRPKHGEILELLPAIS